MFVDIHCFVCTFQNPIWVQTNIAAQKTLIMSLTVNNIAMVSNELFRKYFIPPLTLKKHAFLHQILVLFENWIVLKKRKQIVKNVRKWSSTSNDFNRKTWLKTNTGNNTIMIVMHCRYTIFWYLVSFLQLVHVTLLSKNFYKTHVKSIKLELLWLLPGVHITWFPTPW